MSKRTTTTEATEAQAPEVEAPEVEAPEVEATEASKPPEVEAPEVDEASDNEAAKYRRRLRDTETERDDLRSQVENLQRAEAERHAERIIKVGASLWAVGIDLTDLIGPDGKVDPDQVRTAALHARDAHGLAQSNFGGQAPNEGMVTKHPPAPSGYSQALN